MSKKEKEKKDNLKVYVSIREYDGWENWNIIKICDYPCNNKREAELKEDKYITKLKANMNMIRASRTKDNIMKTTKKKYKNIMKKTRPQY